MCVAPSTFPAMGGGGGGLARSYLSIYLSRPRACVQPCMGGCPLSGDAPGACGRALRVVSSYLSKSLVGHLSGAMSLCGARSLVLEIDLHVCFNQTPHCPSASELGPEPRLDTSHSVDPASPILVPAPIPIALRGCRQLFGHVFGVRASRLWPLGRAFLISRSVGAPPPLWRGRAP